MRFLTKILNTEVLALGTVANWINYATLLPPDVCLGKILQGKSNQKEVINYSLLFWLIVNYNSLYAIRIAEASPLSSMLYIAEVATSESSVIRNNEH